MIGLPRSTVSDDTCETLLLISQATRSGIPLPEAVRLALGDRAARPCRSDRAFLRLADRLEQGVEPKIAIRQSRLPEPVVNLFLVALENSDFATAFEELTRLEMHRTAVVGRVVQALAYPVMLSVFMAGIILFLFLFVVPQFVDLFNDFGTELPLMTAAIFGMSQFLRDYPFLVGIAVFFLVLFLVAKYLFPRFWFYFPLLGEIGKRVYMTRILRQTALLVRQDVSLPEALRQCAPMMRNPIYRKECLAAALDAEKGIPFLEIALRYYWLFPPWLAPMVGKNSSRDSLVRALRFAAETTERQENIAIMYLQSLCLPLFVLFFFFGIGMTVISLFLPLFRLVTSLSG